MQGFRLWKLRYSEVKILINFYFIEIQLLLRGSAGTAQKTGTGKLMSVLACFSLSNPLIM